MPRVSRKDQEAYLSSRDPILGAVIAGVSLPKLVRPGGIASGPNRHFATLAISIISQQISDKAAGAIANRFRALYGGLNPTPAQLAATSDEDLRGVGLSGSKVRYLKDLSGHVLDGRLDLERIAALPEDEVMRELVAVKGIGPWTAEMFMIFSLGMPDVFSFGDVGLVNAMVRLYRLRKPASRKRLETISKRWSPYRSLAARYLWASSDGSGGAWN